MTGNSRILTLPGVATALLLIGAGDARASMVAYWNFDELGGSIANASVGGVNGALNGGAVFVPGAPNPQSGSVYLMTEDRIKPAGIPPAAALKCLTRLGAGSSALLHEIRDLDPHTTKVQ